MDYELLKKIYEKPHSTLLRKGYTERVVCTAGDNVPAEIEYRDEEGNVVGYWAYGSWDPAYPYQGE